MIAATYFVVSVSNDACVREAILRGVAMHVCISKGWQHYSVAEGFVPPAIVLASRISGFVILQHAFASWLVMGVVSLWAVKDLLVCSSISVTDR